MQAEESSSSDSAFLLLPADHALVNDFTSPWEASASLNTQLEYQQKGRAK
jgi:hypothetical protein